MRYDIGGDGYWAVRAGCWSSCNGLKGTCFLRLGAVVS